MLIVVGHSNVLIVGALKESVEHVLFECVSYDFHRQDFFNDTYSNLFLLKLLTLLLVVVFLTKPCFA